MILDPETSQFIGLACELYVPGDEDYARRHGFAAYASAGITRGRCSLALPPALIYDGAAPVTVESSLSRFAMPEERTFLTVRDLGRHLMALKFELSIRVAYPIQYGNHVNALHLGREITVGKDNGSVTDRFVVDVPACDSRLQKPAGQDSTIAFMKRIIGDRFSPSALATGLTSPNVWPVIGNDEIEALAVGPVFPGEGPSQYENSRREALAIASRVAQTGYTLTPQNC
jgi:hypothetical protein